VVYNAGIPPEFFDFVIVDECHRSIYELWAQVLLVFRFLSQSASPPRLPAALSGSSIKNLVMQYGHDEAVADGVNVDFDVWRIRTTDYRDLVPRSCGGAHRMFTWTSATS
jgi:type I restriction enzyme R subunit